MWKAKFMSSLPGKQHYNGGTTTQHITKKPLNLGTFGNHHLWKGLGPLGLTTALGCVAQLFTYFRTPEIFGPFFLQVCGQLPYFPGFANGYYPQGHLLGFWNTTLCLALVFSLCALFDPLHGVCWTLPFSPLRPDLAHKLMLDWRHNSQRGGTPPERWNTRGSRMCGGCSRATAPPSKLGAPHPRRRPQEFKQRGAACLTQRGNIGWDK